MSYNTRSKGPAPKEKNRSSKKRQRSEDSDADQSGEEIVTKKRKTGKNMCEIFY
jgi:hypothetical protein